MPSPITYLESCWVMETARQAVLSGRGHGDASTRAGQRAKILNSALLRSNLKPDHRWASTHAEWMTNVAGTAAETGTLGWFFLQRLGTWVDAHASGSLKAAEAKALTNLAEEDSLAVAGAISREGFPETASAGLPKVTAVGPPGEVIGRFALVADPHLGLEFSNRIVPVALSDAAKLGAELTVVPGDLTQDGSQETFEIAARVFKESPIPTHSTLGNHDMWSSDGIVRGFQRFDHHFHGPGFEVVEGGSFRIIVLNSAIPQLSEFPPFNLVAGTFTDLPPESVVAGSLSDEVLEFMNGLEPSGPTFIALHHPPFPYPGIPPVLFGLDGPSTDALGAFAKRLGAWGILCGHTHRSALYELAGIPVLEVPSVKEWPFSFLVVEVASGGWAFKTVPISDLGLIEEGSKSTTLLHRRYAQGKPEDRSNSFEVKAR